MFFAFIWNIEMSWPRRVLEPRGLPLKNESTQIFRGSAGALFGRDRSDDQAARLLWIEGNFGAVKRCVHKRNDFRIVESGRAFQHDVASHIAAAKQAAVRVGNAGALKKAKTDVVGI